MTHTLLQPQSTMNSIIFSDDEARFLRLVLKLAERPHDDKRASWMPFGLHVPEKAKAAGEFRFLVIGGQGVGKTSLLTKARKSASVQNPGAIG